MSRSSILENNIISSLDEIEGVGHRTVHGGDKFSGSVIINDDVNEPKLVNSRMSVQENHTFLIPEHFGNCVTNVYDNNTLDKDTSLLKLYDTIPEYIGNFYKWIESFREDGDPESIAELITMDDIYEYENDYCIGGLGAIMQAGFLQLHK